MQTKLPKALFSGWFCTLKSMKNHHNFARANDIANFFEFSWKFMDFHSILGSKMQPKIRRTARRCLSVPGQQAWIPSMDAFTNIQWGRFGFRHLRWAGNRLHFGTRFSIFFLLRFLRSLEGTFVLQNLQKWTPNPLEIRFLHHLFFESVLHSILVRFLVALNLKNIDFAMEKQ